jgi:hypothetical protein
MKKTNMYPLSVKQWNPWVGCKYNCIYYESSFQRQLKRWGKEKCPLCYEYKPHAHRETERPNQIHNRQEFLGKKVKR